MEREGKGWRDKRDKRNYGKVVRYDMGGER